MQMTNWICRGISFFLLSILSGTPLITHADTPLSVCVKNTNGQVTAQSTCPAGTKKFSEKSYSEGRSVIFYVAPKGAAFKTIEAAVSKINTLYPAADKQSEIRRAPGTHQIPNPINIPSNVQIVGAGRGITTVEATTAVPFFMDNNTAIKNFTLNSLYSGGDSIFIQASSKTDLLFEDLEITFNQSNENRQALYLISSSGKINRVSISGTANFVTAVAINGADSVFDIKDLEVNLSLNGGYGIEISNGAAVKLFNSKLTLTTVTSIIAPAAIRIGGASTSTEISDVISELTGNTINCSSAYITESTDALFRNSKFLCAGPSVGTVATSENAVVTILNSLIKADAASSTLGANNNSTINIAHSHLDGGNTYVFSGGIITCAAMTDENFAFNQSTCP